MKIKNNQQKNFILDSFSQRIPLKKVFYTYFHQKHSFQTFFVLNFHSKQTNKITIYKQTHAIFVLKKFIQNSLFVNRQTYYQNNL